MTKAVDVAAYIVTSTKEKEIEGLKLQKLLYYCQAWHLVWYKVPLFPEEIQAWEHGPVVPAVYDLHRRELKVSLVMLKNGDPTVLSDSEKTTIDRVFQRYGWGSSAYLRSLTHSEKPWIDARKERYDWEPSRDLISTKSIRKYYKSQPKWGP